MQVIGAAFADDAPARKQLIKGINLYQSGKCRQAIVAIKKLNHACQSICDIATTQYFLGLCCDELGDYAPASDHYREVLAVDPDHVPTQIRMAMHCIDQQDPDEAIARLNRVLQSNPTVSDAKALLITAQNMSAKR